MAFRILHVCETATGGVATYLNLLSSMPADAVTQVFLVPSSHRTALGEALSVTTFKSDTRGLASLWRMVWAILQKRRSFAPDIVFFHSTFALIGLLALRLVDRQTHAIYCAHGWAVARYSQSSLKGKLVRAVEGRLCGLADVVVNVSRSDRALATRLGYRGRQAVVENAVVDAILDARGDLFSDEADALHLLFVGRFDRQKGLDVLLKAFAVAHGKRPDLRLHIVGAKVREDGGEIILPEGASLAGWVEPSRIDDWYHSADAVVVPSRWEGLPLVIPEALRNRTPILCSTNSGMGDLIDPGATGQSFALDEDSLSRLFTHLDRTTLRAMRSAARTSYEMRFRPERLYGEIASLYRDIAV